MSERWLIAGGAAVAVIAGLGTLAVKSMKSASREANLERAALLKELEATAALPRSPASPIESVVRYQLELDGKAHDVVDGKVSLADEGKQLSLSPTTTRTFNGEEYSFEYPGALVVGSSEGSVSVTAGDTDLRLLVVDTANPRQLLDQAVLELETMSGEKAHVSKRRIGSEEAEGKTLRMDSIGRAKELYVVALDATTGLNVEIVRAAGAKTPQIATLLASISKEPLEVRDDFVVRAGSKEIGGLRVGTPKELSLDGSARVFRIVPRETVRHRLGRVHLEYPQSAVSSKVETPLGSGLQIGLHATAISVLVVGLSETEVASAFLSGQRAPKPISRAIAGETRSGSQVSMPGMTLELFTMRKGAETLVVMIQYADTVTMDAGAPSVLASIRVD